MNNHRLACELSNGRARLPNYLWIARKRLGYSQHTVARLLGHTSAAHLSEYEHGTRLPTLETALKLEIVLRTPVAFLYRARYKALKQTIRHAEERLRSEQP